MRLKSFNTFAYKKDSAPILDQFRHKYDCSFEE